MKKAAALIILILAFYIFNLAHEYRRSSAFLTDACTSGFMDSFRYYYEELDGIFHGTSSVKSEVPSNFPPVYQVSSALIVLAAGKHWLAMILINNGTYLVMLLIFTFLLGEYLGSTTIGLIATLLVALYPLTYSAFDKFSLDFPLMGILAMSLYFLFRSDFLIDLKWGVLFFLSCGLGMMTKEPFGAFIAGPVLLALGKTGADTVKGKYVRLTNFFWGTLMFGLVIYPYYGNGHAKWVLYDRLLQEPSGNPAFSTANTALFISGLWENILSPPFFIVLLPGLYIFIKRTSWNIKTALLSVILVPDAIIFLMPHWKTARYFLPELPVFALISAWGIANIGTFRRWVMITACGFIAATGIFQYYAFKYDLFGLSNFKWSGMSYFSTHDEIKTSLSFLHDQYLLLNDPAEAIAKMLRQSPDITPDKPLTMLFVPKAGDFMQTIQ
jgi:4-amino-4-deoxy-L-arabinose transferase-like glycosyltransferase